MPIDQIVIQKVVVIVVVVLFLVIVVIVIIIIVVVIIVRFLCILLIGPFFVPVGFRWLGHRRRIIPFQPVRPATVNDLFPQPHESYEGEQGACGHKTTPEHVNSDIFRREYIHRQGQQHIDGTGKQKPIRSVRS